MRLRCSSAPGRPSPTSTLPDDLIDPSVAPDSLTPTDFTTPGLDGEPDSGDENVVKSFILKPTPVTAETLNLPLDAGWYATKDDVLRGSDRRQSGSGRLRPVTS